jgi:3',5'-cyclic AMP phosphodiesterase CpdA
MSSEAAGPAVFRILHLSDVHFGPHCQFVSPDTRQPLLAANLAAAKLLELVTKIHSTPNISAVVISGDLSWQNRKEEFAIAAQFVQEISSALGVPRGNFVTIPGNHDIRWSEGTTQGASGFKFLIRELAEKEYRMFYKSTFGLDPNLFLTDVKVFHDERIAIVGLNSCRLHSKRDAGLGYVGSDQIEVVIRALRADPIYAKAEDEFIKIAVLHHHLLPMQDLDLGELDKPPADRKLTLTIDASNVLEQLMADNFALVLHGHQHLPFCAIERRLRVGTVGASFPTLADARIGVWAAGSYAVSPPHATHNHLQIIDIERSKVVIHGLEWEWLKGQIDAKKPAAIPIGKDELWTSRESLFQLRAASEVAGDVHKQSLAESELLAQEVQRADPKTVQFLYDALVPLLRREDDVRHLDDHELRDLFDAVVEAWRKEPDALERYKRQSSDHGVTFVEYVLILMVTEHARSR